MEIIEIKSNWHPRPPDKCLKSINDQIKDIQKDYKVTVISMSKTQGFEHNEFIYEAFLSIEKKKFIVTKN